MPYVRSDEDQAIAFDLSDPTDLEVKLENLTDKEMDELLKQAYKVNKELKHELQRQERVQSGKPRADKSSNRSSQSASSKGMIRLPYMEQINNGQCHSAICLWP